MSDSIHNSILTAWPNCAVADCEHKACASRNSRYCSPHTDEVFGDNSAAITHFDAFRRAQLLVSLGIATS